MLEHTGPKYSSCVFERFSEKTDGKGTRVAWTSFDEPDDSDVTPVKRNIPKVMSLSKHLMFHALLAVCASSCLLIWCHPRGNLSILHYGSSFIHFVPQHNICHAKCLCDALLRTASAGAIVVQKLRVWHETSLNTMSNEWRLNGKMHYLLSDRRANRVASYRASIALVTFKNWVPAPIIL